MPLSVLLSLALLGYALWDTRARFLPPAVLGEGESDNAPDLVDQLWSIPDYFVPSETGDVADRNVTAFLDTIEWAEGTRYAGGYQALYGSRPDRLSTFSDFSDHPALRGWPGVTLTDAQCRGAGFGPGCVSTAAGRYQITRPTWQRVRRMLSLPDFGPASQDLAAIQLINEKAALEDVKAGRFATAVDKVRRVWASLPGAGYAGQAERSLTQLASVYQNAGGTIVS